jgi:hypothetical protein
MHVIAVRYIRDCGSVRMKSPSDMANVNTAQLPAIMSALTSAVYNYHIGIITSGNFLTNDQTGAPLPGNSYANMETLLGLQHVNGAANTGDVTVTAADVSNPIMKSYTAGVGYDAFTGAGGVTADVLVNENVAGGSTLPGVVETTTGGTNMHCTPRAMPASRPCAWTWTRRRFPRTCLRSAAGPASMTSCYRS